MSSANSAPEELSSKTITLQVASMGVIPRMDCWELDSPSDVRGSSISSFLHFSELPEEMPIDFSGLPILDFDCDEAD